MKSCLAAFGAGVGVTLSVQAVMVDNGPKFFCYMVGAALLVMASVTARHGGE